MKTKFQIEQQIKRYKLLNECFKDTENIEINDCIIEVLEWVLADSICPANSLYVLL